MTGDFTLCGNDGMVTLAGLAVDKATGNLYGAQFGGTAFCQINPANGTLILIGNAGTSLYDLGSTSHGVYAIDAVGSLYSVSIAIGALTKIGSTGVPVGDWVGLSTASSKLYYETDGTLYSFSTRTARAKLIGSGPRPVGGMVSIGNELYGGDDNTTSPPNIWSINPEDGAQPEISTVQDGEITETWGLAPTPKGDTGNCPAQ